MITIIDTGIANTGSVVTALLRVGAELEITTDTAAVWRARALLLPGVGAFRDGMESLQRYRLVEPIREFARSGRPVLGICLGMQLLADVSEEFGEHEGLGLIPGRVRRLPALAGVRVPNIGWCDVTTHQSARLFTGIESGASFYFVHSYYMHCTDPADEAGDLSFASRRFTIAIQRGNVYGAQFHPEKSQDSGLAFLANFARLASS